MNTTGAQEQTNDADICIADSGATHTILKSKKYFYELKPTKGTVDTISGPTNLIEGVGKANLILPNGTKLLIENALFSPKSTRNLLSFKNIYHNGYDTQSRTVDNKKYLHIMSKDHILEKLPMLHSGLHYTHINVPQAHMAVKESSCDPETFNLWHDRLGHPGSTMMKRIIENTHGHPLKYQKIPQSDKMPLCTSCSLGKLITRPSSLKVDKELPMFLERIQGDICGPIHPPCGPFRYFMVLIDASSRWSHVSLLSTRNIAFAKFLAQIIKLRAHFPDYTVKRVRLDNAGEFTSHAFNDYCMSVGIVVEHPVAHVHTQNGLAESLIKRLQLIARPLIMRTKLPVSVWGHAILHAGSLIRVRPSANHKYSPLQLISGNEPDISHLKIFGCAVYVPIAPPQRTKMGPQRRLGIYVGYETASIIRYLEPLTGDVFKARFDDCRFNEAMFPALGGENKKRENDVSWCVPSLSHLDPRTKQCETEVQKIIHLQNIANQLPDAFTDTNRVTKSHIPAANAPARVEIPSKAIDNKIAHESQKRLKRGRPIGSKDKNPRKRKALVKEINHKENDLDKTVNTETSHEKDVDDTNKEISINYGHTHIIWNRYEMENIDEIFSYSIASDIMGEDDDPEPKSVNDCQNRHDWDKWKGAMQAELDSLNKRKVFGSIVVTPKAVKPVGYKWVFVRKRNEKNEVTRYKARLVAQGFSQRPGIDYEETYSPVMDAITFRYLISLAVSKRLEMRLMDVATAYLYGSLDSDIYMKVPEGFKLPEALSSKPKEMYSIKLQRSLYGLKQSGRMWYNRLSDYLTSKGYTNNLICPCVFIKKTTSGYVIIAVYVDDLNIIGTQKEIHEAIILLKKEFEMKDLGKTKYCLGLQIEHMSNGILVHQTNYTEKLLKRFNMDKANPLSTPMVVRSLNVENDPFRPCEGNEEVLGPEVPYLSAIGALMYLTNCTRPDISFAVNLLARFSSAPTKRHWNGVKHIFRYLRGTVDLGLFYPNDSKEGLVGYADAGYLSDPHKAKSQTGYVFMNGGTAISWRSQKQTLVATSSNHAEVIALHEASRECVWLRSMSQHIVTSCGLEKDRSPTLIHEDNAACVSQMKEGYIKSDRTKHIPPRFFAYTRDLIKDNQVEMRYVQSSNNSADLFTKSLPTATFRKHVHDIGMRHVRRM
ncbi:putative RNA-directed DNA polymerase [Helianthus anomalus]